MGFLINIKYHPKKKLKNEDGSQFGYETDIVEEKTFRVGKRDEEKNHEDLAAAIMQQLSRRDILVCGVEATEFVQKKLKVRESPNGIVIGNRRYTFEDSDLSRVQVEEIGGPENRSGTKATPVPANLQVRPPQPIRNEYFVPSERFITSLGGPMRAAQEFQNRGLTINKMYPVFREDVGRGTYAILNNNNVEMNIPIENFSSTKPGGETDSQGMPINAGSPNEEIPLKFGSGQIDQSEAALYRMPVLRQR